MSKESASEQAEAERVEKSAAEWQQSLTPEQFAVTRQAGTERAFSGCFWNEKAKGTYLCVCCGAELFSSDTKFDSGSGWPSFHQPTANARIAEHVDNSLGVTRTEVTCGRCDAHLGHVFPDGPPPTGLRYCVNSAALELAREDGETERGGGG